MLWARVGEGAGIAQVFPLIPDIHRCLSQPDLANSQHNQPLTQGLSTELSTSLLPRLPALVQSHMHKLRPVLCTGLSPAPRPRGRPEKPVASPRKIYKHREWNADDEVSFRRAHRRGLARSRLRPIAVSITAFVADIVSATTMCGRPRRLVPR